MSPCRGANPAVGPGPKYFEMLQEMVQSSAAAVGPTWCISGAHWAIFADFSVLLEISQVDCVKRVRLRRMRICADYPAVVFSFSVGFRFHWARFWFHSIPSCLVLSYSPNLPLNQILYLCWNYSTSFLVIFLFCLYSNSIPFPFYWVWSPIVFLIRIQFQFVSGLIHSGLLSPLLFLFLIDSVVHHPVFYSILFQFYLVLFYLVLLPNCIFPLCTTFLLVLVVVILMLRQIWFQFRSFFCLSICDSCFSIDLPIHHCTSHMSCSGGPSAKVQKMLTRRRPPITVISKYRVNRGGARSLSYHGITWSQWFYPQNWVRHHGRRRTTKTH